MPTGDFWTLDDPAKPKGIKDPDATIDLPLDWSEWLADISDTHASHSIAVTGGLVVDSSSYAAGIITVWVSGGTVGATATVRCRIVTTGGRTDDRTWYLKIKER